MIIADPGTPQQTSGTGGNAQHQKVFTDLYKVRGESADKWAHLAAKYKVPQQKPPQDFNFGATRL